MGFGLTSGINFLEPSSLPTDQIPKLVGGGGGWCKDVEEQAKSFQGLGHKSKLLMIQGFPQPTWKWVLLSAPRFPELMRSCRRHRT